MFVCPEGPNEMVQGLETTCTPRYPTGLASIEALSLNSCCLQPKPISFPLPLQEGVAAEIVEQY